MSTEVKPGQRWQTPYTGFVAVVLECDRGSNTIIYRDDDKSAIYSDSLSKWPGERVLLSDPEIVTHPDGGKHRPCSGDLTLFPPESILAASVVLERGAAEYGVDNWRMLPLREHLRHALTHVYLWLSGNRDEPHLTHAMIRLAFAAALEMAKENKP